ncbi:O-methyltransferase [Rhynchospora pubera]|uniref:O-methyltransferase n=1 Tax=Rhynchospora pubera TaxID=906938 RepID=A0AAV8H4R6_9POAL|nr:O-methyltransferase [Rhynchospora pubera]
MPLHELARSIPIPPEKDMMLDSFMELLVHQRVFAKCEAGYLLTPTSELMLSEGANMGAFVYFVTDTFPEQLFFLGKWFKDTGKGSAFQLAHDGKPIWDVLKEKPELGTLLNKGMESKSKVLIMFVKIPPTYTVLHDWLDEDCVRILKRCKEAIESTKNNGKVIVIDLVIDVETHDSIETETKLLSNFSMMSLVGGKERTKKEWHDLILNAGFSDYKICPARMPLYSVIELYP